MIHNWFKQAKLGIFIHWGIYAVNGIAESWSFYNGEITYEDYMKQCEGFTAANYDPKRWANLIKQSGAKYAVLTTKHHDGVALFDTKLSDLSVVKKTPAGRDLVEPFCSALRALDLRVGLYFTHLDWSHPGNAAIFREDERENLSTLVRKKFTHPKGEENFELWETFLQFHRGQLKELLTNYGQIDLLWFDGGWEKSGTQWKAQELNQYLRELQPDIILNSRMWGYGDYETPEQGVPIIAPEGPWEFCVTINDTWGYQHSDKNYKSVRQLVRMFSECIAMGGNMLLDIGPMADGSIDFEEEKRLIQLGQWINMNEEAIYLTKAGLPAGHFYGASTLSEDEHTLYLIFFDKPFDSIAVKGIQNDIKRISILATKETLNYNKIGGASWLDIPGVLWIDIPETLIDENATVVKVEFEDALRLYRGKGEAIEQN